MICKSWQDVETEFVERANLMTEEELGCRIDGLMASRRFDPLTDSDRAYVSSIIDSAIIIYERRFGDWMPL